VGLGVRDGHPGIHHSRRPEGRAGRGVAEVPLHNGELPGRRRDLGRQRDGPLAADALRGDCRRIDSDRLARGALRDDGDADLVALDRLRKDL
jgi:hypothetical protein